MKITTVARRRGPEPRRDQYGRPYVVPPQGGKAVPYTRCTGYVGGIEDTYMLGRWYQRWVAKGVAGSPDLIQAINDADPDDRGGLNNLVDEALSRTPAGNSAKIGTYVHALTEAADRGEDPADVEPPMLHDGYLNPDLYKNDLDAYLSVTRDLEAVSVEQFSVLDPRKVAGTPDRVVRYRGKRYIADVKTGSIELGALKIAAQLAVYSRSRPYDVASDERMEPHGAETDKGIIIHLPAGTGVCQLWWIDLLAGWDAVMVAGSIREQRQRKFVHLARELVAPPPAPSTLAEQIQVAATYDELTALWRINAAVWDADLTRLAQARTAVLMAGQGSTPPPTP